MTSTSALPRASEVISGVPQRPIPTHPAPSFTVNGEQADMLGPSLDPRRSLTVTPPFSDLGRLHRHDGMRLTSMEQAAQAMWPGN